MILTFQNDPTVANWNDEQFIQNSMFSIHKGLANVQDIITPLDILKERKSQAEIVKNQKKRNSQKFILHDWQVKISNLLVSMPRITPKTSWFRTCSWSFMIVTKFSFLQI